MVTTDMQSIAYSHGPSIVADYLRYSDPDPDHVLGPDSRPRAVMQGGPGRGIVPSGVARAHLEHITPFSIHRTRPAQP